MLTAILSLAALLCAQAKAVPGTPAGLTEVKIQSGGRERRAWVFAPKSKGNLRPLVLLLCSRQGVEALRQVTSKAFETAAARDGWVVAYPETYGGIWNDGRGVATFPSQKEGVDDLGFLMRLAARLARDYKTDPSAVFVTGYSAGGMMALRLACERAKDIAGAASVSGPMVENIAKRCRPNAPVSVAVFLGTQDPIMEYDRGVVRMSMFDLGRIVNPKKTMGFWTKADGCSPEPRVSELPDLDKDDGSKVRRHRWSGCRDGAEVTYYEVLGGGHTWPGGQTIEPPMILGTTNMDLDATGTIWDFFKRRAPTALERH